MAQKRQLRGEEQHCVGTNNRRVNVTFKHLKIQSSISKNLAFERGPPQFRKKTKLLTRQVRVLITYQAHFFGFQRSRTS